MTAEELRALAEQRRQGTTPQPPPMSGMDAAPMSADELRRLAESRRTVPPAEQGFLRHLGSQITEPAGRFRDAVVGPRDPREAETQPFTGAALPNDQRAAIQRGRVVTFDDDAYADVVRQQLGNRFIAMERDENDYPIVTYLDRDGQQRREYVNMPGLDWEDVDRGLSSALPFMFGAGVANFGLRGLGATGVGARMLAQGTAASSASIGSDYAARNMGSQQPYDFTRAVIAGAGGTLFEGLSGPMTRTWEAIFRRHPIGPDGRLTGEAAEKARAAGLDPTDMNERLSRAFARDMARGANPEEVAAKFRTGEFDIPTTMGQRTKFPDQLGREEEMRRGLMGQEVQGVMREFDTRQRQSIEGAFRETIPERVAPQASARDTRTLGDNVRDGARAARDASRQRETELWSAVGDMFPEQGAFSPMPGHLARRIDEAGVRPDPDLTPAAARMLDTLEGYARREVQQPGFALLPSEVNILDVDGMRRRLLGLYRSAAPGSADAKASRAVYDAFNDWIDDAAQRALLSGAPDSAAALSAARGFTRETKALFEPRGARGQMTPAARRIASVLDDADSGEGVIRALFGSGGPRATPPEGSVQALQHMKDILVRNGQERVWDDVRMAYWLRIGQDQRGGVLSAGQLRSNIDGAFSNQATLMDTLFTGTEQAYMKRLARALDDVVYEPPNPSGTSYELMRMQRAQSSREPVLKTVLSAQAKRELFSKGNVLMSRIYAGLAKRIPNVANARDAAAMPMARQATSQEVQRRRPGAYFIAPTGAFAGVELAD